MERARASAIAEGVLERLADVQDAALVQIEECDSDRVACNKLLDKALVLELFFGFLVGNEPLHRREPVSNMLPIRKPRGSRRYAISRRSNRNLQHRGHVLDA